LDPLKNLQPIENTGKMAPDVVSYTYEQSKKYRFWGGKDVQEEITGAANDD
jgi:hypothetical protein